jgi:hypothetical protein
MLTIQIQPYYNIGYAVVSLIFLIQIVGYGVSSLCGNYLHDKLGRHKFAIVGAIMQCICYSLICWAPPFPVMVCNLASVLRLWMFVIGLHVLGLWRWLMVVTRLPLRRFRRRHLRNSVTLHPSPSPSHTSFPQNIKSDLFPQIEHICGTTKRLNSPFRYLTFLLRSRLRNKSHRRNKNGRKGIRLE